MTSKDWRVGFIAKKKAEENASVKHKECVPELTPSMLVCTISRKDPTKSYGQFGSMKFFCLVYDGHVEYKAMFDAVHENSFEAGDQIGFEAGPPDENGFYKVTKRSKICNLTRSNQVQPTEVQFRPKEEIEHLILKCEKRLSEISKTLANKPVPDLFNKLQQEKRQINKVLGVLQFVQSGLFPSDPERDPREAYKNCHIVTRNLGKEDLSSVLEKAETRMKLISTQVENYKESVEYHELQRFIIILKWVMDKSTTHTHIALHFNLWLVFNRHIKEDYDRGGIFRDEYLTKDRRQNDMNFLMEDAKGVADKIHRDKQMLSLQERFPFITEVNQNKKGK